MHAEVTRANEPRCYDVRLTDGREFLGFTSGQVVALILRLRLDVTVRVAWNPPVPFAR